MSQILNVGGFRGDFRKVIDKGSYCVTKHVLIRADGENSFAVGTNGKIAALVPITTDGTGDSYLPAEMAHDTKSPLLVKNGEWRRTEHGRGAKNVVAPIPEDAGRYPAIDQVFNAIPEQYALLRFDVRLLAALADAIAVDGAVDLFIPHDCGIAVEKPVFVRGENGIGVIMPLSTGKNGSEVWPSMQRFNQVRENYLRATESVKNAAKTRLQALGRGLT